MFVGALALFIAAWLVGLVLLTLWLIHAVA
jgi:hypothetical protein